MLPVLTLTAPDAAASALRWRHSTLPLAIDRAAQLGLAGAAFPWRTIAGQECSGYWPAGTAAFHINADIADAVIRYVDATGDEEFARGPGMDLLVHTARLWRSLGHHDAEGRFHIDGVTGPDEYSAVADDNVYTNLMARKNLLAAADAAKRYPDRARELGVDARGVRQLAGRGRGHVPSPTTRRSACTRRPRGSPGTRSGTSPAPRPSSTRCCCTSPTSTCTASRSSSRPTWCWPCTCAAARSPPSRRRGTSTTTSALTVRDSSLSACTQAVIAAEVGHLDLAFDYLGEAALMDLRDLEHNTRDGVHIASLAGAWIALVGGFGGLRHRDGTVSFAPRLPQALSRLAFTLLIRGRRLRVEVDPHRGHVLHSGRQATRYPALRRAGAALTRAAEGPPHRGRTGPAAAQPAAGAGTRRSPPNHRGWRLTGRARSRGPGSAVAERHHQINLVRPGPYTHDVSERDRTL